MQYSDTWLSTIECSLYTVTFFHICKTERKYSVLHSVYSSPLFSLSSSPPVPPPVSPSRVPSFVSAPPVFLLLQSLSDALISLQMVYPRRNLSADQWRNAQLLSLISAPSTMLNPAQSDTVSMPTALKWLKKMA